MRRMFQFLAAFFAVFTLSFHSYVSASPRQIAASANLVATVSEFPSWCQETVAVTVRAPTQDVFTGERVALQRFLGQIRMSLEDECSKATNLRIVGVVESRGAVFLGQASRATGWALTTDTSSSEVKSKPTIASTSATLELEPNRQATVATSPSQQMTPIQACDRLGAHPDDPEAFTKGVLDSQLNAKGVISACEAALPLDKNAPRLAFQLARGYLKLDRLEDAIEQLVNAAKQGHGGSLAYLADIHLDGGPGIDPDPALAHLLYTRAAAAGFEPAKNVLVQFEDYTEKSNAADMEEKELVALGSASSKNATKTGLTYVNPGVIENILKGQLDEVTNNEAWVKEYLIEVADNIGQECKKHFTAADIKYLRSIAAIKSVDTSANGGIANIYNALENMAGAMNAVRGGGMGAMAEQAARDERDGEKAMMKRLQESINDSFVLLMQHPCGSAQISNFSKSLTAYVEDAGVPRQTTEQLYQSCQQTNNKNRTKDGNQFCFCISRKLTSGASMTRAERKGLAMNYSASAQNILNKNYDHFKPCF